MMQALLKPDEVATMLGCKTAWVRRLVQEGKLRAVRNGPRGRIRITHEDLADYIESNRGQGAFARPHPKPRPRAQVLTPEALRIRTRELAGKRKRPKRPA